MLCVRRVLLVTAVLLLPSAAVSSSGHSGAKHGGHGGAGGPTKQQHGKSVLLGITLTMKDSYDKGCPTGSDQLAQLRSFVAMTFTQLLEPCSAHVKVKIGDVECAVRFNHEVGCSSTKIRYVVKITAKSKDTADTIHRLVDELAAAQQDHASVCDADDVECGDVDVGRFAVKQLHKKPAGSRLYAFTLHGKHAELFRSHPHSSSSSGGGYHGSHGSSDLDAEDSDEEYGFGWDNEDSEPAGAYGGSSSSSGGYGGSSSGYGSSVGAAAFAAPRKFVSIDDAPEGSRYLTAVSTATVATASVRDSSSASGPLQPTLRAASTAAAATAAVATPAATPVAAAGPRLSSPNIVQTTVPARSRQKTDINRFDRRVWLQDVAPFEAVAATETAAADAAINVAAAARTQ